MTTDTATNVTQYFSKVTLTPITSIPTHETMNIPQAELNDNAMSVPSDNT